MDKIKVVVRWGDGYSSAICPLCGQVLEAKCFFWLEFFVEMHFKNHGIEKSNLQFVLT